MWLLVLLLGGVGFRMRIELLTWVVVTFVVLMLVALSWFLLRGVDYVLCCYVVVWFC